MTTAWHLPKDHTADYLPGVSLTLSDLLRLQGHAQKRSVPRYVRHDIDGGFRTRQKGRGMDYAESRVYQQGDEIRHMDWRVTARTGRWHTKVFHVERERPVLIVLDQSRPMFFGSRLALKSVVAARLAAQALWQRLQQGERIGLIHFDDARVHVQRPTQRRSEAIRLLQQIVSTHASQLNNVQQHSSDNPLLQRALDEARRLANPGTLLYLFVDLMSLTDAQQKLLALIAQHCLLRCYGIYDVLEQTLPTEGRYAISDGRHTMQVDAVTGTRQQQYKHRFEDQCQRWKIYAQQHGFQFLPVATQDGIAMGSLDEDMGF